MKYLIPLLFPISLLAETTGNLLPQQFFNNNQGHNGWNCTDPSHNHGNSIVAAVHGDFIENTISLGDTLSQSQINGGWTSTFGADMWGWNTYDQEIKMTQTITDANGTVTTQVRDVAIPGCSGYNCGSYATYTDSYTQGLNNQSNYTIKARFDFSESSQSTSHRAIDLKNPTLTIEHSLLSATQQSTISEINETVDETIQQQVETIEFLPIEEYTFEVFEEPEMVVEVFEEIYIEPIAREEINTGIVDIFFETVETIELTELPPIESFEEIPMEVAYEEPKTIEAFTTEVESFEERIETTESFNNTPTGEIIQEIFAEEQTPNSSRISQRETPLEEVRGGAEERTSVEETARGGNESAPRENKERVSTEPREESTVAESTPEAVEQTESNTPEPEGETTVASEEVNEVNGEGETTDSERGSERTETVAQGEETLESRDTEVGEGRDQANTRADTQTISIESIEKKVNETLKRVDQRLIATSLIVARAMESPLSMDNYGQTNNNIFNNQLVIDGGSYDDQREYLDLRDIYAENQIAYNDPVAKSQRILQESIDNRIRAEEHLRKIRGY
jgi:hypothetical protein